MFDVRRFPIPKAVCANPIAFLPDGNTIVARSFGGVQLWHAPSFAEIEESEQRSRWMR